MALLKGKTVDAAQKEMKSEAVETETQTVDTEQVNAALEAAQDAEREEVVETAAPETKPEEVAEQATETEPETVDAEQEAEQVEETESPEPEKEEPVNEKEQVIEDAEVVETVGTEQVAEDVVEPEQTETETEQVAESKAGTAVAEVEQKSTAVAAKAVATNQVIAAASDNGFDGLELGFGSFAMIKLENEGQFADSDDNELGKHIRATLQQSTPVYLYKQEGNEDGPIAYSYDRETLTSYKGDEGDEFKTVEEIKAAWAEEGYDLEEKKYLEVVATIVEDHENFIEGEVPEGLEDLEGETVMFRLAPASLKAFSGKVATLQMRKQPIQGAVMDFLVGKKRKTNNGKSYYPWKFRLVK